MLMHNSLKGLAAGLALLSGIAGAAEITGAGASFPNPIYSKWADAYQKATGNRVNYQSIGSSGGIRQIRAKTVDFGASDAPLKPDELQKDGLIQFPTVIGGVVPVVNLPGVKPGELKLTGTVLGDIYLGKINKWNDKAIDGPESGRQASRPGHRRRAPRGRFGDDLHLHQLPVQGERGVEAEDRRRHHGAVAGRPGRQGQRGRRGFRAAPAGIDRLRRVRLRQAEQARARAAARTPRGLSCSPSEAIGAGRARLAGAPTASTTSHRDRRARTSWPITGATFILVYRTAEKPAADRRSAQVLQLGVRERRQDGAGARLRADARHRREADRRLPGAT